LLCDNVSQAAVEQVLDRAKPYFEILIVDGSEDLNSPVSSVGISQSSQLVVAHRPSVASGLWFRSVGDFIYQLHLTDKMLHVVQETPWSLPPSEYTATLGLNTVVQLPYISNARQLEDSGTPIYMEKDKACRRYNNQVDRLVQTLQEQEVFS
jgi:Flp pilus assembly CpaE family ATPase